MLKKIIKKLLSYFSGRTAPLQDVVFYGNFSDWESAARRTDGYDRPEILERVKESAAAVRDGRALFERDSVQFHKEEFSASFLACMAYILAHSNRKLNVIDFGGSLGSTFYQYRQLFGGLKQLSWSVVEQENFVKLGQRDFQSDSLSFFKTMQEAIDENGIPDLILFSSVLQYLRDWDLCLKQAQDFNPRFIIIDRTPLLEADTAHRICIENVPETIYKASYPCWFFERSSFLRQVNDSFRLVFDLESWESWDLGDVRVTNRCLLLERKQR